MLHSNLMRSAFYIVVLINTYTTARILHKPREVRCSTLIVFGDSFSDDGVEAMGPSHGFVRDCNGPNYAEYLNKLLQCETYLNFAYSGAKSGQDNFYFNGWSGVQWQVDKFLEAESEYDLDPIIVFQSGGSIDFFTGDNDSTAVLSNIQSTLHKLTKNLDRGTLIVLSLMDVSSAPGVRSSEDSDDLRFRLGQLVSDTNRKLGQLILDGDLGVRRMSPSLTVQYIDINPIILTSTYHLNTTQPFSHHSPDTSIRSAFRYAYHDLWNPSTIVHYAVAKDIARQLQDL
ncbi:unnamed protein product [Auanema sp. JU1783]|nr:unnamed protein product [Auanema sp. JU1783]